ncbi:twin-arginine translocase subunit TatC [Microcella sp.]|uniref:twin-arginine translocase subunit TatC n=1 Tax=Microcella sp. TaxID=1913979 RepID=UPI002614C6F5|nr:twin-arginine translocase subunit TatC [Microcella sp.]
MPAQRRRRMSIGEHLRELRRRLGISAAVLLVAAVAGFFLADVVWAELSRPLQQVALASGREAQINYTSVTEAFDTRMMIALAIGVVLSSPMWLYQTWAYVVPALKRREKLYAVAFLGAAVPLFAAGCAAGWFVIPNIVTLLTSFAPEGSATLLTARTYLDFALKLILAVGVGFVLPILLVMLNAIGVLTGAAILRSWRWAVIVIALFTALATPAADVLSMLLLAAPMLGLYFAAAAIAVLVDKRRERALAKLIHSDEVSV